MILLIRHSASTAQHPNAPLTDAGSAAALRLAGQLAVYGVDAAYSSPYARAVATIAPFADQAGLNITCDDRLRERVLAAEPIDDFLDHIRRSFDDAHHRVPGGESLHEAGERGLVALREIAAKRHRLPVAVSHGNLISAVLRSANPEFGFDHWRALKNPDLFMIIIEGGKVSSYRPLTLAI